MPGKLIVIRVPDNLKTDFEAAVQAEERTVSQTLRLYMRRYADANKSRLPVKASDKPVEAIKPSTLPQPSPQPEKSLPELKTPIRGEYKQPPPRKKRHGRPSR
jgi:antitoxin component of RelBE/YafQ-DinJ toxin-antitoxin module